MLEDVENNIYLGDGVYAEKTDCDIILRTGDHRDGLCQNKIHLDDGVLKKFKKWLQDIESKRYAKTD